MDFFIKDINKTKDPKAHKTTLVLKTRQDKAHKILEQA